SSVGVSTVVHISVPTKETFSTKGFDIDCHSITGSDGNDAGAYFLHNAHHLVADCNTRNCTRNTAMFNMKITGADTAKCYTYDCIPGIFYLWPQLLQKFKLPMFDICICKH